MRYVKPEYTVKNHAKEHKIPNWDIAIMCFHSIEKTIKIVNYFQGKKLNYRLFSKCDSSMVFEAKINNKKIGLLGWCTGGGPLVSSLIEELTVTGVRWLIGIGAAATIVPKVKRGEIIIPTKLLISDGLSRYYTDSNEILIDSKIYSLIKTALIYEKYREVTGATIEAIYRQSDDVLSPLRKKGVEVVNWEVTPFYAVARKCNIRCAWIGHISDVEWGGVWRDWFWNRNIITDNVIEICKKVIEVIIDEDKLENNNILSS